MKLELYTALWSDLAIVAVGSKQQILLMLDVCWTFAGSFKHPITLNAAVRSKE